MATEKDFKEAKVRQILFESVYEDLIGPSEENEEITDLPTNAYIMGMLFPADAAITEDENYRDVEFSDRFGDAALDADQNIEASVFEDDEADDHGKSLFKKPSSAGVSFYVAKNVTNLVAEISWGRYTAEEVQGEVVDGTLEEDAENKRKKPRKIFVREQVEEKVEIDLTAIGRSGELKLKKNENVSLYIIQMELKNDYKMISVYIHNNDKAGKGDKEYEKVLFQVNMILSDGNNSPIFTPEYECRDTGLDDEYYYQGRPVYARGRGCAAKWDVLTENHAAHSVGISFMPSYEIHSVSAEVTELEKHILSVRNLGVERNREESIRNLRSLAEVYKAWIQKLEKDPLMDGSDFVDTGKRIIGDCTRAYERICEGIDIIESDETAFKAFLFMNNTMFMQKALSEYSAKYGSGVPCKLREFMDEDSKPDNKKFDWRPFQIAFILLNIKGIINDEDPDREVVDLLYFPTGGGKTEAYLGLIAFTVGYRRLTATKEDEYNKDGGVTVFLRYTLRLLTTQQRDRLLRLVVAMEMTRIQEARKAHKEGRDESPFGHARISIGFWVGKQVTPNKFSEYDETDDFKRREFIRKVTKQILKCPCCGTPIDRKNFKIIPESKSVLIHCASSGCYFSEAGPSIPVYLVDEEIYSKCPTIIISTVDKFATLPWNEQCGALFGNTDRYCCRCGYLAIGERHVKHRATGDVEACDEEVCRRFYPPELIIQDELHLITGPLGTIYGGYETVVEEMCSITRNGKRIKPKYVVSTATIKNAGEQIRGLYSRERSAQFPPSGLDIRDSFFIREVDLPSGKIETATDQQVSAMIEKGEKPFRQYVGICAPGQSVKTTIVRLYSAILQKMFELSEDEEYVNYVDPYYTLIGYFNSIRELGGAVRLLDDDIVSRIRVIMKKHKYSKQRFLNRKKEITSRVPSWQIAEVLEELMEQFDPENGNKQKCYDVVIATNMIAVGMDVGRLGLMTVVGQPKQNSEYIQATSRVGREHPGIIFTVYNPYRPRDLSNYENFVGFHSQMYRYVEGTTATPFAARARDRDLHALVVSLLRLQFERMADNGGAANISTLTDEEINAVKKKILDRVAVVANNAYGATEQEMNEFISTWKGLAHSQDLTYWIPNTKGNKKRLLSYYGQPCGLTEIPTLSSMRDVEQSATLFHLNQD